MGAGSARADVVAEHGAARPVGIAGRGELGELARRALERRDVAVVEREHAAAGLDRRHDYKETHAAIGSDQSVGGDCGAAPRYSYRHGLRAR